MRYASMRKMDISNGEGVGTALFVQGCSIRCKGCFNSVAWDFNGGKEWTEEVKNEFLKLASKPYVTRISILGGCPLAAENREDVLKLIKEIRDLYPDKKIWLFSGYVWENIFSSLDGREKVVELCDVLIDGPFEEDKKDLTLKFRGSKNQRVIDVQASLKNGEVTLWTL